MAKRRRRRRVRRRKGVTLHPGVSLLRPTRSRPYYVLRYTDEAGDSHQQSTGCTTEGPARDAAIELSRKLGLLGEDSVDVTWTRFCDRYETERLASKSPGYRNAWGTVRAHYADLMKPQFLDEVNSSSISRFTAKLRKKLERKTEIVSDATIASYLKTLRVALNWAHRIGLLSQRVAIEIDGGDGDDMRSRPITLEEFERILMAVPKVRTRDAAQWEHFLRGLWESGFRLGELWELSWDDSTNVSLYLGGRYPMVRFAKRGQKRRKQQYQPITPEFWALIDATPYPFRHGRVFPLLASRNKKDRGRARQVSKTWAGEVVAKIGVKAGVITALESRTKIDPETGEKSDVRKKATSHDIGKRALTMRLADRLSEIDLAKWQRHKDPRTTRRNYHHREADDLAAQIWAQGDGLGDGGPSDNESEENPST